jgi:hypothetical protein
MSGADRQRARRAREKAGRAVVAVEIDTEAVTAYLVDAELLHFAQVEDRQAIGIAVGNLLDLLIAAEQLRRHAWRGPWASGGRLRTGISTRLNAEGIRTANERGVSFNFWAIDQ